MKPVPRYSRIKQAIGSKPLTVFDVKRAAFRLLCAQKIPLEHFRVLNKLGFVRQCRYEATAACRHAIWKWYGVGGGT